MLFFIVIEAISDQQQYNFQTKKYRKIKNGKELKGDYKRGFVSSGLWSISRHPNFACEQLIWISFYLFSIFNIDNNTVGTVSVFMTNSPREMPSKPLDFILSISLGEKPPSGPIEK